AQEVEDVERGQVALGGQDRGHQADTGSVQRGLGPVDGGARVAGELVDLDLQAGHPGRHARDVQAAREASAMQTKPARTGTIAQGGRVNRATGDGETKGRRPDRQVELTEAES